MVDKPEETARPGEEIGGCVRDGERATPSPGVSPTGMRGYERVAIRLVQGM